MAFTAGLEALISAGSASTDFGYLLNTSSKPYSASVSLNSEALDITGFESTAPIAMSMTRGIAEWSGSFAGKFPQSAPASGHEGLVTFGGYTSGMHGWSITATATEHDVTAFSTTPPAWKSFISGLYSFSGNFLTRVDTATALGGITSGAATFRTNTESSNDNTLSGNILLTSRSAPFEVNGTPVIQYDFVATGNMSFDGDNALFNVASAGTPDPMTRPEIETITIRTAPGGSREMSGDAFLTSWTLGATIGSPVEVSGSFRGTGALTDS